VAGSAQGGRTALRTDTDPQAAGEPIQIYDVGFRSKSDSLTGVLLHFIGRHILQADEAVVDLDRWIDERETD